MHQKLVFAVTITIAYFGLLPNTALAEAPIKVEMVTTEGTIVLELYPDKAPKTVANFLAYIESGHYAETIFHRVINGFMIQGGGLDVNMAEKPTKPPVRNEAGNGLTNDKYTIAMARTGEPHSATSQFFINTADNNSLNRAEAQDGFGYTVFGKVVTGQAIVDKIETTPTKVAPNPKAAGVLMEDVPVNPISITSIRVVN
jgi:cyclophilin family peptidyl-prolyl cis-trans isomerase